MVRAASGAGKHTNNFIAEGVSMAGLTVTEKEHWKERIERRLDKRIEAIWARDPNLKERIDDEARQKALESLHSQRWVAKPKKSSSKKSKLITVLARSRGRC